MSAGRKKECIARALRLKFHPLLHENEEILVKAREPLNPRYGASFYRVRDTWTYRPVILVHAGQSFFRSQA
ncbi:hypothetical protein ABE28_017055 [Peribacillus muralis]|uniref:Uncharacterized protein n=1 Tax=Peribacillus muralis TaxID=264697 RepID=A0A1B3XS80_9BACI|nr:hypothetical protein ABE28_017055 [Peribacillus muralis]